MRPASSATLLLLAAVAVLTGCGGGESAGKSKPPAPKAAAKISVSITSPSAGASVKASTRVTGIVTPTTATVDVNGEAAAVADGRFEASVVLERGEDQVRAVAAANGVTDDSVVALIRQPTAA